MENIQTENQTPATQKGGLGGLIGIIIIIVVLVLGALSFFMSKNDNAMEGQMQKEEPKTEATEADKKEQAELNAELDSLSDVNIDPDLNNLDKEFGN